MIDFIARLLSPIFLPMGVSYADLLLYLNAVSGYLLVGAIALVLMLGVLVLAGKLKKAGAPLYGFSQSSRFLL